MKGYSVVALDNPKNVINIGGVLRAAGCYRSALVVIAGHRHIKIGKQPADTQRAYKHIPHVLVEDVFDALPYDCVPIAVELVSGAIELPKYQHPERGFYIFGAEDQTLGKRILSRCRDRVMIPTNYCMNLAATVNVVLYDRMAKSLRL